MSATTSSGAAPVLPVMDACASSKPRIAILHYTAAPVIGGVEHVITQHARLFQGAGYPVQLIAGRGGDDESLEGVDILRIPEIDSDHPENRRVTEELRWEIAPRQFASLQERIEQRLAAALADCDVLFAHNVFHTHFNLPLTAALHHLRDHGIVRCLVAWTHDISRHVNPLSGAALHVGPPWDLLRTYRPDVTYVAVSRSRQHVLAHVLGCPPEQIRVIPNGADPGVLLGIGAWTQHISNQHQLLEADLVVLMPIRITRAKNIMRALQVIAALRDLGVSTKLIVTGPPDPHCLDGKTYLAELMVLRRELQLERDVIFLCEVAYERVDTFAPTQSEIGELYRLCDLVLMTSDREGFGLPIIEGGLVGRPVFTTETPALEELAEDSTYRIERDEGPVHIAERIATWAKGDVSYHLRRQVRRDYTWSAIFQRYLAPLVTELFPIRVTHDGHVP